MWHPHFLQLTPVFFTPHAEQRPDILTSLHIKLTLLSLWRDGFGYSAVDGQTEVFCFVFLVVVLVVIGRHICLTKRRCIKNTWTSCDLLVIWSPNEKKSRTSHDDITINKVPLVEMCHQTFHVFWSIKENIQHAIWNMMQQKFDWLKPARQKETVKDANIFINQIVPTQLLWCWRTLWYYLHTSAAHSHRS